MVDAVMVPVPDLDEGLLFYWEGLGHELIWRNDELGQAGLRLPDSETELVLSTKLGYAVNWLVASVADAVATVIEAGGELVVEPTKIPVGQLAVTRDPFGNSMVLLDLSSGPYRTDADGHVLNGDPDSPNSDHRAALIPDATQITTDDESSR
jgi:predicted enzyme related to lactoylglutathione lyase